MGHNVNAYICPKCDSFVSKVLTVSSKPLSFRSHPSRFDRDMYIDYNTVVFHAMECAKCRHRWKTHVFLDVAHPKQLARFMENPLANMNMVI